MNIQSSVRKTPVKVAQEQSQNQGPQQPVPKDPQPPRDFLTSSVEILKDTGMFVLNEAREAGENDPALGLRIAANRFDAEFLDGTGDIADGFSGIAVACVRGGLLGANIYRTNRTFKDPNAQWYHKALDVGRVASDMVGLAGAVMAVASPSLADTGKLMTQVAYGVDLVSHSVRFLEHGGKRIQSLSDARAQQKMLQ